ncbi:hypothetical protein [Lacrimispora brassicae]
MMEKIRIVLKAKENPSKAMLKREEKEGTVAVIRKENTADSTEQEVRAV